MLFLSLHCCCCVGGGGGGDLLRCTSGGGPVLSLLVLHNIIRTSRMYVLSSKEVVYLYYRSNMPSNTAAAREMCAYCFVIRLTNILFSFF